MVIVNILLKKYKKVIKFKKIIKYIQILISLLLITYLFCTLNYINLINNLKKINIFFALFPACLYVFGIIISSKKWGLVLNFYKINIKNSLSIYWIGSFFSNFLPSSFGGDGYRFYYINKYFKEKKKENLSAILFERITGIFIIAFINIIGFIGFFNFLKTNNTIFLIAIGIFCLSMFIILIFIFGQYFYKILLIKFIKEKVKQISYLLKLIPKKILFKSLLLSFLYYISIFIGYLSYFKSVGIDLNNINFILLFYLITIINLFGLFPISLNGIGVSESLQVLLFSNLLGISPELILLTALIGRLGGISMSSIGGLIYLKEKISK